jgi:hypothetical protein
MTVLLDFWPMARDLGRNRMTKFRPCKKYSHFTERSQKSTFPANLLSREGNTCFRWNFEHILRTTRPTHGQKSIKTVIALEGKTISAYPFRLFLLSLGPTYGQDITSKQIYKLVTLPREYFVKNRNYWMSFHQRDNHLPKEITQ